jgi:cytochrome c553
MRPSIESSRDDDPMLRLFFPAFALALLLSASVTAHASGDPEAGKIKGYTCTGCHGIPGYVNVYPTYHVPLIGGQSAMYIEAALKAYQTGERTHSTMNLHAESLTDEDIADIAAWLATETGDDS